MPSLLNSASVFAPDIIGPVGCAVAVDLGLLGYYKYTGYFMETLNEAAGTGYTWRSLILPLGISFYTFQQLTLLADIGSGRIKQFRFEAHAIRGDDRGG